MSWHSLRDRVITLSGKQNPSVRDFVDCSGRGTLEEGVTIAGTPDQVADTLEEWFGTCCDGFVLAAASVPGSYDDFARLVTPVLQSRGLIRHQYTGTTLRDNLGLAVPGQPGRPGSGMRETRILTPTACSATGTRSGTSMPLPSKE